MLNVFDGDAFQVTSLTTAINLLPTAPTRIGDMGLFTKKGVPTTTIAIEYKNGRLALIPTAARGTMPNVLSRDSRNLRMFNIPHIPVNATVMADEVQGVRKFGSEDQVEGVSEVINDKLQTLKNMLEVTKEWHRVGGAKGVILDADASTVIYDLFDEFGLEQTEVLFDLSDAETDVKNAAIGMKRTMSEALGNTPYRGIHVLCGDNFFDALTSHAAVKEAFNLYNDGSFFREDQRTGFEFPMGVFWENYTGGVGDVKFFSTDQAYAVPLGVPDLFMEYYGPADFEEAVNTIGLEVYAKQERMKFDVGTELHAQTNPLMMCTRPACLLKLVMEESAPTS